MQFRAQPKPVPAFATLKTDAANSIVFRQLADRDGQNFLGFVEPQRHGGSLAGKTLAPITRIDANGK